MPADRDAVLDAVKRAAVAVPTGRVPTVLVVDDEAAAVEFVTDLIAAKDERPALVLMDVRMPGMDGTTAMRHLKADPLTAAIPVVALTAQAMEGDRATLLAAGFDDVLNKPIDTRGFVPALQRFLSDGRRT